MKIGKFIIQHDKKTFDEDCWICLYPGYLHIEPTLFRLLVNVVKEYKHDRHMVG